MFSPINKLLHLLMRMLPGNFLRIGILRLLGVKVGKNVWVSQEFFLFDAEQGHMLTLEDNVAIGPRVTVLTHVDAGNSPLLALYPCQDASVKMCQGCWIGAGAIILPGVTIGEMSLVAAGAVVTKNVEPLSLVAGVPAKVVKKLVMPES